MTATASHSADPGLEAAGLHAGYRDLQVLRDVTVRVWPGQLTVLLGSNSAGETTTLRTQSGLNKASAGTVTLFGREATSSAQRTGPGWRSSTS